MTNLLTEIRSSVEKRLRELEPAIEEHAQLAKALEALKDTGQHVEQAIRGSAKPSQPVPTSAAKRRGRPRGTGGRAQEALKLVHEHPGITIAEMAERMKIKANYLYRVLPHLEREEKIKKQDKGYHPVGADTVVPGRMRVRREQKVGYPQKRPARRS